MLHWPSAFEFSNSMPAQLSINYKLQQKALNGKFRDEQIGPQTCFPKKTGVLKKLVGIDAAVAADVKKVSTATASAL